MIGTVAAFLLLSSLVLVRDSRQAVILVVAFTFRVALSVVHISGLSLPDSQFDARSFEEVAWLWARDGRLFDDFTTGSYLYSWIGSGIYLVFGRVPFLLHVINSYFGTITIYFVMQSARLLVPSKRLDRSVGWTLAFYPSVVLYSVLTMREAPIVLAVSISIYLLLCWVTCRRIIFGWGAIFFMLFAQMFHAGLIAGTLTILLIYSGVSFQSLSIRDNVRPIALFVMGATGIALAQFSLRTGVGIEKIWGIVSEFDIDAISSLQAYSARGRGAYLSNLQVTSFFDFVWQVPLRVFFFFGSPFVWMVSKFRDILGLLDAMVFLLFTVGIVRHVKKHRLLALNTYLSVALVAAAIVVLFALATSNYGTAFRHRAKVFPSLLLLYLSARAGTNAYSVAAQSRGRRIAFFDSPHRTNERS